MKRLAILAAAVVACVTPGRAAACANSWTVYFGYGSAEIRADAAATINSFLAALLSGYSWEQVQIVGHSDQTGARAARQRISERRAHAVRDYLMTRGIPRSMIEVAGLSDGRPEIDAGENVREPNNRRAQLFYQLSPAGVAALTAWQNAELAAGRQLPLC